MGNALARWHEDVLGRGRCGENSVLILRASIGRNMLRTLNVFRVVEVEGWRNSVMMLPLARFRASTDRLQPISFIARFGTGSSTWHGGKWFLRITSGQLIELLKAILGEATTLDVTLLHLRRSFLR